MTTFRVIEGSHKDPNNIETLYPETKIIHGPFDNEEEADQIAKRLIQKNIDNYYHLAWVIKY